MKFDLKKLKDIDLNKLIEIYTDKDYINSLGYRFAIALLDEKDNILEIKFHGKAPIEEKTVDKALINVMKKSDSYYNYMNKFPW